MIRAGESWDRSRAERYAAGRKRSAVDDAVAARLAGAGRILEVGCGPGMLQTLLDCGILVETDRCRWFLPGARAGSAGGSVFCCADALALPFGSGTFDAVAAMAVLHHLDDACLEGALGEARRILAPGGRLVVAEDWAFDDPTPVESLAQALRFGGRACREHHRSASGWAAALEAASFGVSHRSWATRPFDPAGLPGAGPPLQLPAGFPDAPVVRMLVIEGTRL